MLVLMETGGLTFFFLIFKGANWKSSGFTVTDAPKKIFKWTQDHKRGQHQPLDHNHSIHCLLPFGPDCQFGIHQDSSHAFVRCNVLLYTCMLGSGHIDQHHKLEVVFLSCHKHYVCSHFQTTEKPPPTRYVHVVTTCIWNC
jgi:hypothetical protein